MTSLAETTTTLPLIGFGTMEYVDGTHQIDEMTQITTNALTHGYKLLDCAELYESTVAVGKAIAQQSNHDDLMIISKLRGMPIETNQIELLERVNKHLAALQVPVVDVLLMHWPGPSSCDLSGEPSAITEQATMKWFVNNIEQAWRNMVWLQEQGVCHQIGVSNCYRKHLDIILSICQQLHLPPPTINEIFIDPCHPEYSLVHFCQKNGLHVVAYRPLAFLPVIEMAAQMGDGTHAMLLALASTQDCSPHSVVLAWLASRGVTALVKTSDEGHLVTNLAASSSSSTFVVGVDDGDGGGGGGTEETLEGIPAILEKFGPSEMVAMCGGTDPYADAFRDIAEAASAIET